MIVAVVLENEYGRYEGRINFFLEVVNFARREDVCIIINEGLFNKIDELIEHLPERFYDEFEIDRVTKAEIDKLDIYCIPDSYFEEKNKKAGTRSKALLELYNERDQELIESLIKIIDGHLDKRKNKDIDYFLNNMEVIKSIAEVAKHYHAPIIPYVFSSIRKAHGYAQTLYVAHIDSQLYSSKTAENMYGGFVEYSKQNDKYLLRREEILALLGKKRNLKLIPYIGVSGYKEIGFAAGGRHILPVVYQYDYATDDDVNYILTNRYSQSEITVRLHPNQMNFCGIGRAHMQNDPVGFILGSRKLITVQSQLMIKAALWGKAIAVLGKGMPYAFLFSDNLNHASIMSELDLNFLMFCYLVPSNCMWDRSYWLWRMKENPSAVELFEKHVEAIGNYTRIPSSGLLRGGRYRELLMHRGLRNEDIDEIINGRRVELTFPFLLSRAEIYKSKMKIETLYAINEKCENGMIRSVFRFDRMTDLQEVKIYLLDDIDGYIVINRISINGKEIRTGTEEETYSVKGTCNIHLLEDDLVDAFTDTLEVDWKARTYEGGM